MRIRPATKADLNGVRNQPLLEKSCSKDLLLSIYCAWPRPLLYFTLWPLPFFCLLEATALHSERSRSYVRGIIYAKIMWIYIRHADPQVDQGQKILLKKKVQNKVHMKSNLHHNPRLSDLHATFYSCFSCLKIHNHIINNTDISKRVKILSLPKRLIDNNYWIITEKRMCMILVVNVNFFLFFFLPKQ